jgi:hypothetical protein
MSVLRTAMSLFLLGACTLCLAFPSLAQQLQEQAEVPLPTPPPPPPLLPLAQMPAGPVITLYQNGELTIEAQNSNLRDVLRVVSAQTGTLIDIPPGHDERVVGVFGPGRPREVLASLLNGSPFNYVMLWSTIDPNRLEKVALSLRSENPVVGKSQSQPQVSSPDREPDRAIPNAVSSAVPPQVSRTPQPDSSPAIWGRFMASFRRRKGAVPQPVGESRAGEANVPKRN